MSLYFGRYTLLRNILNSKSYYQKRKSDARTFPKYGSG